MRGALLSATLVAVGVAAAPASAADVTIQNFQFNPTAVTIAPGETVTWHYAGPDTNHSVTADAGQAESWDSDPARPPTAADHPPTTTFQHKFDTPGTFTYFCKVHGSMQGKVTVTGAGGPPPPSDTTAPAIDALRATGGRKCRRGARHCKPKPTVVRFTLSEDAQVKLSVAGRPKVAVARALKAGSNSVRISTRKLPPGKYTVRMTATDAAGNASAPAQTKVKVKRR
jgi:plastocyanin